MSVLAAQEDIIHYGHFRDQIDLLVYFDHARLKGFLSTGIMNPLAFNKDFTPGWWKDTVEYIQQRRFSRTILAQQRMDLTLVDTE